VRFVLAILVAASFVVVADQAEARGRRFRAPARYEQPAFNRHYQGYYSQYYGGFHARHLQNIGVPTGDIGIRGNGITTTPW
jgi:hypothetical protein